MLTSLISPQKSSSQLNPIAVQGDECNPMPDQPRTNLAATATALWVHKSRSNTTRQRPNLFQRVRREAHTPWESGWRQQPKQTSTNTRYFSAAVLRSCTNHWKACRNQKYHIIEYPSPKLHTDPEFACDGQCDFKAQFQMGNNLAEMTMSPKTKHHHCTDKQRRSRCSASYSQLMLWRLMNTSCLAYGWILQILDVKSVPHLPPSVKQGSDSRVLIVIPTSSLPRGHSRCRVER